MSSEEPLDRGWLSGEFEALHEQVRELSDAALRASAVMYRQINDPHLQNWQRAATEAAARGEVTVELLLEALEHQRQLTKLLEGGVGYLGPLGAKQQDKGLASKQRVCSVLGDYAVSSLRARVVDVALGPQGLESLVLAFDKAGAMTSSFAGLVASEETQQVLSTLAGTNEAASLVLGRGYGGLGPMTLMLADEWMQRRLWGREIESEMHRGEHHR